MSKPASSSGKILRVGVIRDGKIIEERHMRHPGAVTVGQDGTNTFVIPASELPVELPGVRAPELAVRAWSSPTG